MKGGFTAALLIVEHLRHKSNRPACKLPLHPCSGEIRSTELALIATSIEGLTFAVRRSFSLFVCLDLVDSSTATSTKQAQLHSNRYSHLQRVT